MSAAITGTQLAELSSDNPRVKYRRAKMLVAAARQDPRRLSAHLPFFVKLLESENTILKWVAIDVLGALAAEASKNRVDQITRIFVQFLRGGRLITANHAIAGLANVALARPELREKITRALLRVEEYPFETGECHNIALGKVLDALAFLPGESKEGRRVVSFARRQLKNRRPATRKKAEKLLTRCA